MRLPETTISLTGKEKTFTNTSEEPESHPDQSTTQGAETPTVLTRIIESGIPPLATIRLFSTSAPIVDVSVQLCSTVPALLCLLNETGQAYGLPPYS